MNSSIPKCNFGAEDKGEFLKDGRVVKGETGCGCDYGGSY